MIDKVDLHISLHKMEGTFGDAGSAQNGVSHSSSHGTFNKPMPLVPVQSGAVIGVAGPATNLNIGMDYWGATGSSPVPAMRGKVPSGSARGEQWVKSLAHAPSRLTFCTNVRLRSYL